MSEHYFTPDPSTPHKPREIALRALGMTLTMHTDAGVFSSDGLDPGSRLLMESLPPLTGRVADLGCGWGAMGVPLALKNPGAEFSLTDVNARAVDLARQNIIQNQAKNARATTGDGLKVLPGPFEAVITNPPIRAGKQVIYGLFAEAKEKLAPGGKLYIVIRKQQGAPSALKFLQELFHSAQVIERGGGYWVIEATKETSA
jgi:16S rRNA (guanine1207-N2)-methyltransferase